VEESIDKAQLFRVGQDVINGWGNRLAGVCSKSKDVGRGAASRPASKGLRQWSPGYTEKTADENLIEGN
jgi:hypothetical protein